MSHDYSKPARNPDDLMKILARTTTGRALLEEFLPFLHKGRITIENYPAAMRAQLREFIPAGHAIGACLVGESPTSECCQILVDFEGARGTVAAFLVHEITSFLVGHRRSSLCREDAEAEALRKQLQFTTELRDRDPAFEFYLKANASKAALLHDLLEFELEAGTKGKAA